MDSLLNIRAGSERASRRRKRGEAAVDLISTMGLPKKLKLEDGFTIQANNIIPDLKSAWIGAPAGLITVFGAYSGMKVYESDYFAGAVYSSGSMSTFDYVLKEYTDTGLGLGDGLLLLLQGQPEETILYNYPYSNMNTAWFLRNGSWYMTEPIGGIIPASYQYPDSWPTAGVFPCVEESAWLSLAGTDLIYDMTVNACVHHETVKIGHLSSNSQLGGRTMLTEQKVYTLRPPASAYRFPVSTGYREIRPVKYMDYPIQDGLRFFGTIVEYIDGIIFYDRINLETILHDPEDIPETHTGPVMPEPLREIMLHDEDCTCRPDNFYAFSNIPDKKPVVFAIIDLTSTVNLQHMTGADKAYFDANAKERKWRLSCHWLDMETGETWSFTGDQFWDLLDERVRNLTVGEDWETAPSSFYVDAGWRAAITVLDQWFGRPNHNFMVPHDTWNFHAEDGNIYAWSRYYGNIKITKAGIDGLDADGIRVPQIVTDTAGVRPTIFYSGLFDNGVSEPYGGYICVCEKLDRATASEDLPQGNKEVLEIYTGSPFIEDGWSEIAPFVKEVEGEAWSLVHVRVVFHKLLTDGSESLMLLGVARKMHLDNEENEVIQYYSGFLERNSITGGKWQLSGKYGQLDTIDPLYGDRMSVDMCLFGDNVLSPQMMKYPSPPHVMSQMPFGPYDDYYSGLP